MQSSDKCDDCGTTFGVDGGTPVLLAKDAIADVSFRFPQRRSSKGEKDHSKYIHYPEFLEGTFDGPYHLDRAHAAVLVTLPSDTRILEIGCGGGQMRTWIQGRGMKYVGVDISKTRVHEWLRTHGGPDIICDAHFLPFLERQFDVVYVSAVTQYVACPIRYAQEVRRVLKPGGYFLSNVAFLEPWNDSSHFQMSPDGVIELLLQADFDIVAVWPGRGYHTFTAMLSMVFFGPFRLVRYLGWMPMALYRLQGWVRNLKRRLRGAPPLSRVLQDCVVAGAIDWIAKRPK
jgi:SAM-dependent methyltransferase